jgi:hypothetical protein
MNCLNLKCSCERIYSRRVRVARDKRCRVLSRFTHAPIFQVRNYHESTCSTLNCKPVSCFESLLVVKLPFYGFFIHMRRWQSVVRVAFPSLITVYVEDVAFAILQSRNVWFDIIVRESIALMCVNSADVNRAEVTVGDWWLNCYSKF